MINLYLLWLQHSLAFLGLTGLLLARVEPTPVPVAFVREIGGEVTLHSKTGSNKLNSKTDVGRILYSDETVSCRGNAKAVIHISGLETDVCRGRTE